MNKGMDDTSVVPLCCLHFGRVTYKCIPTRRGEGHRRKRSSEKGLTKVMTFDLALGGGAGISDGEKPRTNLGSQ